MLSYLYFRAITAIITSDVFIMKVNEGTEDEFLVQGYHSNKFRTALYVILCVLTGGLLWVILRWFPEKRARFTHDACTLEEADIVILYTCGIKKSYMEDVIEVTFNDISREIPLVTWEKNVANNGIFRYFEHMFLRYCITSNEQVFELSGHDRLLSKSDISNFAQRGVSVDATALSRRKSNRCPCPFIFGVRDTRSCESLLRVPGIQFHTLVY